MLLFKSSACQDNPVYCTYKTKASFSWRSFISGQQNHSSSEGNVIWCETDEKLQYAAILYLRNMDNGICHCPNLYYNSFMLLLGESGNLSFLPECDTLFFLKIASLSDTWKWMSYQMPLHQRMHGRVLIHLHWDHAGW